MKIYLDESGCTGCKFDAPYLKGGSSRFLVLGFVIVEDQNEHLLKRACRKIYKARKVDFKERELKGHQLDNSAACQVGNIMRKFAVKEDFFPGYIMVRKENATPGLQTKGNLLYNYAAKIGLMDFIVKQNKVQLIADKRSLKIAARYSMGDYLQTVASFHCESNVDLTITYEESQNHEGLQLADWISNFVWRRFENEQRDPYNTLYKNMLIRKHLFSPL